MRQIFLSIVMALAGSLFAEAYTVRSGDAPSVADRIGSTVPFRTDGQQAAPLKSQSSKVFGKLPQTPASSSKAISRTGDAFNVITEAPEGEPMTMCGNSMSFYVDYGEVMMDEWSGLAYDAVVTEDGDFYLKNPVSTLQWDTYIKGQITDEGITFEFPQPLYRFHDEIEGELDLYADVLEYAEIETDYGYINTFIPSETRTLTFFKDEDGGYTMDPDFMLGITFNDMWQGYGEYNLVLQPFDANANVCPDGVEFNDSYILADEIFGWDHTILRPMSIGFDGTDAYIKGISLALPDAIIKGTVDIETNTISIPTNQLMGRFYNYYIFMMNGDGHEYYDEDWDEDMIEIAFTDEPIILSYDTESDVYTPLTEENHFAVVIFNFGNTTESPCEYYSIDRIYSQGEITDYAPVAPEIQDAYSVSEYSEEYTYCIEFMIFGDNKEGQILQDNNIYYNIFINGELYPLTVEEFPNLAEFGIESITDVPASFSDGDDIYASGGYHGISFRNPDIHTIGVRSLYIAGDVRAESDIVTVEVGTSGVKEITDDSKSASVEYFDITGRLIVNPAAGTIVIRRTISANGDVKAEKMIR